MKRISLIFIMGCLFLNISNAQSLTEQIEQAYNRLDSASYIDNIIQSYAKCLDNADKETYDLLVKMLGSGSDSISVIRAKNRVDSIFPDFFQSSKISNARDVKQFENRVKSGIPLYVLNLRLKDGQTLQVDTSKLAFNLYYFGKRYKGRLYIHCDEGEYSGQDSYYRTFSRKLGKNAPKVFRKIMRKHPKYLLYCTDLERMNTILYVIGNDIYIYRISQMQEYKLDDYMENRKRLSRKLMMGATTRSLDRNIRCPNAAEHE